MYIQYPDGTTKIVITTNEIKSFACDDRYAIMFQEKFNGLYTLNSWTPEDCKKFLICINEIVDPCASGSMLINQLDMLIVNHVIPRIDLKNIDWPNIPSSIFKNAFRDSSYLIDGATDGANFRDADLSDIDNTYILSRSFNNISNADFSNATFSNELNHDKVIRLIDDLKENNNTISPSVLAQYNPFIKFMKTFKPTNEEAKSIVAEINRHHFSDEEIATFMGKITAVKRQEIIDYLAKYTRLINAATNPILPKRPSRAKKK